VCNCVGEILAKDLDCSFSEVAASEQVTQVAEVFHEVQLRTVEDDDITN